jgi:hypothetical protein
MWTAVSALNIEKSDHLGAPLLRPRHKRPDCSSAANQRDELAPFHGLPQAEEMTAYHIEWSCCAVQQCRKADVRFGSKADILVLKCDVRFTLQSGHHLSRLECPLSANSGHSLFDHLVGAGGQRWRNFDV